MISGEWTGTMNLTEPQAGSDLALVRTRAEPQGDGTYKVFGTKIFITYGEHDMAENIVHLVLARVPGAPEGVKGISLFLVPKFLVNADGSLGARNDAHCVSDRAQAGHQGQPDGRAAVRRPRRRHRQLDRRREPRPRVHVHHDERGPLRAWACRASRWPIARTRRPSQYAQRPRAVAPGRRLRSQAAPPSSTTPTCAAC